MFSAELKKGSTEMLALSLLESRARHGYEIGKLIEARSGGRLTSRCRRSIRRCSALRTAAGSRAAGSSRPGSASAVSIA